VLRRGADHDIGIVNRRREMNVRLGSKEGTACRQCDKSATRLSGQQRRRRIRRYYKVIERDRPPALTASVVVHREVGGGRSSLSTG